MTSIISLFLTVRCYGFLYDKIGWSSLSDFFVGVSIYNNHNKYLDVYIYFLYLILFFLIFPFVSFLLDKILKQETEKQNVEAKFNFIEKIKPILSKFKAVQYLFVFGYLFLHPFNGNLYPKLTLLIVLIMLISFFDIYRRIKTDKGFSPFALTALLFCFCFCAYNTGMAPTDDHHFGEKFAMFLMHSKFNLEYYKDIVLVHGLSDVTAGQLGAFFFNQNNVFGYCIGEALHRNLLYIITIFSSLLVFENNILYTIPLILMPVPFPSVTFIYVFISMLKENFIKKPALWFWIYVFFSILFACYWTTIGSFWIIASLPAFIYISTKLKNKKRHFQLLLILLLVLSIVYRNSVFEYFNQAKYYIAGTLQAFGNDFTDNENKPFLLNAFEWFYKMFALFFTPVLLIELINRIKNKNKDILALLYIIFAVLFVFISLKYTMGRLDNGKFYRLEYISFPFIFVIMPYWFYKYSSVLYKIRMKKALFFISLSAIFLTGIYTLYFKILPMGKIPQYTSNTSLYNTGDIELNPIYEKRLTEINNFLQAENPNSVFLDFTNRGMHYLYFDKKIPIQFISYYNSITSEQALNSADRLRKNIPENILVYSQNIVHDGVFPSLRVNALYRWIFLKQKYKYKRDRDSVYLVKTDKLPVYTKKEFFDLDYYFGGEYLNFLPEVWAKSIKSLPLIKVITEYNVQIYGDEIKIIFSTPQKVQNIDLLYFNTNEKHPITNFVISINDSNSTIKCKSKSGKILVPMDNFPSWLLNTNLREITIKTDIQVKNPEIKFFNRIYNHSL